MLGVAEGFDDIRKQFINNRIDTEELKSRLQGGHRRAAAHDRRADVSRTGSPLGRTPGPLGRRAGGARVRDRARQQADDILLAMQKVLDRMIELEDFNQAVELLRNIIKMQDDLRVLTQQRQKQKARELLQE